MIEGEVVVGVTGDGQVAINFEDKGDIRQFIFTPKQARDLAELLSRKADQADRQKN